MIKNFFIKFNKTLEKGMPLLTPTGVIIGLLLGNRVAHLAPAVTVLFAFMTLTGALSINAKDFIAVFKKPLPIVLFLFCFHILMPIIAYFSAKIFFSNDEALITGIVLLFAIPTAVAGSIWSTIHNGNMSLTITLILLDTILAPFLTPFIVSVFMGKVIKINALGMFISLVWMVVIPSIIGICINQFSKGKIPKKILPYCKPFSKFALLFVIIINSGRIRTSIHEFETIFILVTFVALFLSFTGFALGAGCGRLLKLPHKDCVSLMYGSGLRNISAALVLALTYFEPRCGIPIVIGIVFQQTLAAISGIILLPQKANSSH